MAMKIYARLHLRCGERSAESRKREWKWVVRLNFRLSCDEANILAGIKISEISQPEKIQFHCHFSKIAILTSFDFAPLLFFRRFLFSRKMLLNDRQIFTVRAFSVVLPRIVRLRFIVNIETSSWLFRKQFDFAVLSCVIRNSLEWRKSQNNFAWLKAMHKNVINNNEKTVTHFADFFLLSLVLSRLPHRAKIFKWYNRTDTHNSHFHEPQNFCFMLLIFLLLAPTGLKLLYRIR